jgi:23S rRNA (guanosine2251-2'-O)-methyltransferase
VAGAREWVGGRQAVREVLRAQRRHVYRLLVAAGAERRGSLGDILESAKSGGVAIEWTDRAALDRIQPHHQGVAAQVSPYAYVTLEDLLERIAGTPQPLVLALDLIQDPQNLGSLLRTAEAVGVDGVLMPLRRAVGVTEAVVRASAGACEHLLVAAANLGQAIPLLQAAGLWVWGLEAVPEAVPLGEAALGGPLGLVVGNEGQGLRRLVRQRCDGLLRIPMGGRVESLNAAVAGSVALYAAWAARGYAAGGRRIDEGYKA